MGEFTTPKPHSLMEAERRHDIRGFVRRSRSYRVESQLIDLANFEEENGSWRSDGRRDWD
jgi:hypothetical protein